MLRNYLKIAIRSLWRNKLHTAINVLGLSIGLSACFTIFLITNYEFGFDHFRNDADRIYRICTYYDGVFSSKNSGTATGLVDLAAEEKQLFSKVADFFVLDGRCSGRAGSRFEKRTRTLPLLLQAYFDSVSRL